MGAPVTFKSSDLARAVKTMKGAGLMIAGAEITRDGTIRVLTAAAVGTVLTPPLALPEVDVLTPLERWEQKHGHGPA